MLGNCGIELSREFARSGSIACEVSLASGCGEGETRGGVIVELEPCLESTRACASGERVPLVDGAADACELDRKNDGKIEYRLDVAPDEGVPADSGFNGEIDSGVDKTVLASAFSRRDGVGVSDSALSVGGVIGPSFDFPLKKPEKKPNPLPLRFLSAWSAFRKADVLGGAVALDASLACSLSFGVSTRGSDASWLADPLRTRPRLEARLESTRALPGETPIPKPCPAFLGSSLASRLNKTVLGLAPLTSCA